MLYEEKKHGITAEEIAYRLKSDRSNISRDLNQLYKEKRCYKEKTRPVRFFPCARKVPQQAAAPKETPKIVDMDKFLKKNPSLFHQIEQGKAAILYPGDGMHMLLLGETGVGKSLFADLLHKYGIQSGKLAESSPFIQFNCADYAHNPQLLMSQLFGHTKGAYTGAETNKTGLLEKANGGILFLDEIHRLPIEGQEMLFTYIDRGVFRPLGESEKDHHANVLIIGATTEKKDTLLKTFIRRLPIIIDLPSLRERSIEERHQLFDAFVQQEVDQLGVPMYFSKNALKAFLHYKCELNIGQFKADIRIAFAKSYARFLAVKENYLKVSSNDLPDYIRAGLLSNADHRQMWSKYEGTNRQAIQYLPSDNTVPEVSSAPSESTIYREMNTRYRELEQKKISADEIQKAMEHDLKTYFKLTGEKEQRFCNKENLIALVPDNIIKELEKILRHVTIKTGKVMSDKVFQMMAIHIYNLVKRNQQDHVLKNDMHEAIIDKYPEMYGVAKECMAILEADLGVRIPEEEASYFIMFLTHDEMDAFERLAKVQVIVIAHGSGIASALCDTANQLLNHEGAIGINARLDEEPRQVFERLVRYIKNHQIMDDILLLVDMGSLTTFAGELEKLFPLKAESIPLVSTMHVLEASRKAMIGCSLREAYVETLKVNDYMAIYQDRKALEQVQKPRVRPQATDSFHFRPLAIISICLTGEGTAVTIRDFIRKEISFDEKEITIVPINLVGKESIYARLQELTKEYEIICVISTFAIKTEYPTFELYTVMNRTGLQRIQDCIDEIYTYRSIKETILKYYDMPEIEELLSSIYRFNDEVNEMMSPSLFVSDKIGLSFHIIGMLRKIKRKEQIPHFEKGMVSFPQDKYIVPKIKNLFLDYFREHLEMINEDMLNHVAYAYLARSVSYTANG
ncbi:phosphotransferase system mannose-type iia component [Trichococcus shcherbakoviae]|uniref:Phosphotransferase system mannose-type iia component n=2 Tax=Trichococcus shcherbakoviae TaxID=2094020 RepID=A0A383TDH4_9LACT|nr:phosphotransferase system mannose-type iia component [Trichococcus shcherbakoviae]